MKRTLFYLLFVLLIGACSNDDIDDLNNKYDELLEEQLRQAEAIKNHEALLSALQKQLTINKVEENSNGYKIIFSDDSSIEISNGHTPVFTVGDNGNWLIDGEDSGVKAEGSTPEIVNGYWYIDGESTGVKAKAEDGVNAPTITNIVIQNGVAIFSFSDNTEIVVPMVGSDADAFKNGFFIINEGQFGSAGTVHFYNSSLNKIKTDVFGAANSGKKLGNTTQFATIYNEKMYLVSKQGAFVVTDAKTLKETARIEDFNNTVADGRAFCGVNEELGLVSTSRGIYKLNLNPLSLGDKIDGVSGEVGEMLQYRNHIYALNKGSIIVINSKTWEIEKTFDKGKSGLTVSRDGMIWSTNDNLLLKINPYTLEMETIAMPNDIKATSNPWAWTNGSLTASKHENALFFVGGMSIYKYVIGDISSLNSPLIEVPSDKMIYGTGMSVNPINNQVIVTTIDGYGEDAKKNHLYFYDGTTGSLKKNFYYEGLWFASMILFPEN